MLEVQQRPLKRVVDFPDIRSIRGVDHRALADGTETAILQQHPLMLPPHEQTILSEGTGTTLDAPPWFEAIFRRAEDSPSAPAVICGGVTTDYATLVGRARSIAALLHGRGIGPGSLIGVGLDRSMELIATLLGVLRTGAAYVPIDPSYPPQRISTMIASAGLDAVLTRRGLEASFEGAPVWFFEDSESLPPLETEASPASGGAVYAIFTSGSTGVPKAASVRHSGFANLLDWYETELDLTDRDRALVISSPSFDLTQKNFFAPLRSGGAIVLDDCRTYDITRILGLIREHRVTLINCTPSAFYPLVDAAASGAYGEIATLRFAVLGGEPISLPRLRDWLTAPNCSAEVVNSYGPTECTDICLIHRLHRGNLDDFPFVPLGHEIPNVSVSIRDEELRVLPDGDTGELCISGAGLGFGYLRDPAKTAEKFVGGIYRTGDLAKRLPCGTFEFRGRADHQVKVNGHRIELGEIEIALASHPDVAEAVVTSSGNRITAHIQGRADERSLRDHLADLLPSYMCPARFIHVTAFPLTPNGKVDRKALVSEDEVNAATPILQPAGNLETGILRLWSELLERPLEDPTANFFDLGGNSIHLAVVHVRLREMTGTDFPITELFARPNARALAEFFEPRRAATTATAAQERSRLAKAGFARFQRPDKR